MLTHTNDSFFMYLKIVNFKPQSRTDVQKALYDVGIIFNGDGSLTVTDLNLCTNVFSLLILS